MISYSKRRKDKHDHQAIHPTPLGLQHPTQARRLLWPEDRLQPVLGSARAASAAKPGRRAGPAISGPARREAPAGAGWTRADAPGWRVIRRRRCRRGALRRLALLVRSERWESMRRIRCRCRGRLVRTQSSSREFCCLLFVP